MAFENLDDAMFWHGSLIGYMAGVNDAGKDEDKSSLLLRMADTQAKLEFMESENTKLRELVRDALRPKYDDTLHMPPSAWKEYHADVLRRALELGIEVDA